MIARKGARKGLVHLYRRTKRRPPEACVTVNTWGPCHVSPVTMPRASDGPVGSMQCGTEVASGLREDVHVVLHRPKKTITPR